MANCKVYNSYDPEKPPEHPGESWTRFVCISDTHSQTTWSVPPGDVLIHAGDLSKGGTLSALNKTLNWVRSMPHELKIIIAGNHDLCLDPAWKESEGGFLPSEMVDTARELVRSNDMRETGIVYLDREFTEIVTSKGVKWKVYGSPATPVHLQGAFQYVAAQEASVEWSQIPSDVEILVTHGPPFGVLDKTLRGQHVGCRILAARRNKLSHCRLHVFGHIHEGHGSKIERRIVAGEDNQLQQADLVSVNAAAFRKLQPVIVDLKKDL